MGIVIATTTTKDGDALSAKTVTAELDFQTEIKNFVSGFTYVHLSYDKSDSHDVGEIGISLDPQTPSSGSSSGTVNVSCLLSSGDNTIALDHSYYQISGIGVTSTDNSSHPPLATATANGDTTLVTTRGLGTDANGIAISDFDFSYSGAHHEFAKLYATSSSSISSNGSNLIGTASGYLKDNDGDTTSSNPITLLGFSIENTVDASQNYTDDVIYLTASGKYVNNAAHTKHITVPSGYVLDSAIALVTGFNIQFGSGDDLSDHQITCVVLGAYEVAVVPEASQITFDSYCHASKKTGINKSSNSDESYVELLFVCKAVRSG